MSSGEKHLADLRDKPAQVFLVEPALAKVDAFFREELQFGASFLDASL